MSFFVQFVQYENKKINGVEEYPLPLG